MVPEWPLTWPVPSKRSPLAQTTRAFLLLATAHWGCAMPEILYFSVPTTYLRVDSLAHGDSGTFEGKLFDTEVTALERG